MRWPLLWLVMLFAGCSLFDAGDSTPVRSLTLRVATLHLNQRADWERRRPLLEDGLAAIEADIVAFQDVLSFPDASDQVDWIHRRLGFFVRFQETGLPFGAARTGMVLASRFPILETSALTVADGRRTRTLVQSVLVRTPLGSLAIHHVDLRENPSDPDSRLELIERILAHVDGTRGELAPILLGGFGRPPDDPTIERLTVATTGAALFYDAWRTTRGYEPGPTVGLSAKQAYDSPQRARRVDYIFLARAAGTHPGLPVQARRFCRTPDPFGTWPGKHCGLTATMSFR